MTGCRTCGKPLSRVNRVGYCRRCFSATLALSPEREAQRIQNLRDYKASLDPAEMRQRMAALSRRRMAWCPLEYRDDYRRLTRAKCLPAATARRMIEEQIAADAAAYHRTGRLPQAERLAA